MSTGFQQITTEISLEEASTLFNAAHEKVNASLAQKGFFGNVTPPMVRSPSGADVPYNGQIPPDLTNLTDDGLGWYLGMLAGWMDYVEQELAKAHGAYTAATMKLEYIDARLYMAHKKDPADNKKRPEQERKAMVLVDRRYVEAQAEALYHETFYRHVKAISGAAEKNYASLSRRISQRQQDIERQKRNTSVGNMTGPAFQRR